MLLQMFMLLLVIINVNVDGHVSVSVKLDVVCLRPSKHRPQGNLGSEMAPSQREAAIIVILPA